MTESERQISFMTNWNDITISHLPFMNGVSMRFSKKQSCPANLVSHPIASHLVPFICYYQKQYICKSCKYLIK
jgi:hypothetical protein